MNDTGRMIERGSVGWPDGAPWWAMAALIQDAAPHSVTYCREQTVNAHEEDDAPLVMVRFEQTMTGADAGPLVASFPRIEDSPVALWSIEVIEFMAGVAHALHEAFDAHLSTVRAVGEKVDAALAAPQRGADE